MWDIIISIIQTVFKNFYTIPEMINCDYISEEAISDNQKKINTLFARGLKAYRARKWDKSIVYFKKVLEYDPYDGPSNTFLDRYYQNFSKNPPNENWDGVWEMETK